MALVGSSSLRDWYFPSAVSTWLLVQPLPLLLLPDVLRELAAKLDQFRADTAAAIAKKDAAIAAEAAAM